MYRLPPPPRSGQRRGLHRKSDAQIGVNCRVDQGTDEYERQLNFMLSVIRSIRPRDEVEAMLASQMAAVHMATI